MYFIFPFKEYRWACDLKKFPNRMWEFITLKSFKTSKHKFSAYYCRSFKVLARRFLTISENISLQVQRFSRVITLNSEFGNDMLCSNNLLSHLAMSRSTFYFETFWCGNSTHSIRISSEKFQDFASLPVFRETKKVLKKTL